MYMPPVKFAIAPRFRRKSLVSGWKLGSNTARNLGLTKSELVRKSLVEYICKLNKQNVWEAGKDLFGRHAGGNGDLSSNRKALLKDRITAKRK